MPDLLPLAVSCVMLACQHLFSSGAPVLSTLYVICPLTKILIRLLSILEYIFIEIKLMSSIILVSQVQYNIISIYLKTINLVNIHHHTQLENILSDGNVSVVLSQQFSNILLLLSHFSRVRLCVTPQTAAYQAPPSLGFSRQEHWSGLPFPSPMHESEK